MRAGVAAAAALAVALGATAPARADRRKDVAFTLGIGGTALSGGAIAYGWRHERPVWAVLGALSLVATPSLGHWYVDDGLTGGLALRAGGLGLVGLTVLAGATCGVGHLGDDGHGHRACTGRMFFTGLVVGALLTAAGMVWDLATTGEAVDAYNAGRVRDRRVLLPGLVVARF